MIRAFMRVTFSKWIDILFVLSFIGTFLTAWTMARAMGGFSFLTFIATLLSGIAGIVLLFGGIYLLLDIRDGFREKKRHLSSFRAKKHAAADGETAAVKAPETSFALAVEPGVMYEQGLAKTKEVLSSTKEKLLPRITAWWAQIQTAWKEQRAALEEKKKAAAAAKAASSSSTPVGTGVATTTAKDTTQAERNLAQKPAELSVAIPEAEATPEQKTILPAVVPDPEVQPELNLIHEPALVSADAPEIIDVLQTEAQADITPVHEPAPQVAAPQVAAPQVVAPQVVAPQTATPQAAAPGAGALPERNPARNWQIACAILALLVVVLSVGAAVMLMGGKSQTKPESAPVAMPATPGRAEQAGIKEQPGPEESAAKRESPAPVAGGRRPATAQERRPATPARQRQASAPRPAEKAEERQGTARGLFRGFPRGQRREASVYD